MSRVNFWDADSALYNAKVYFILAKASLDTARIMFPERSRFTLESEMVELYQDSRRQAKQLGADVSGLPEDLGDFLFKDKMRNLEAGGCLT